MKPSRTPRTPRTPRTRKEPPIDPITTLLYIGLILLTIVLWLGIGGLIRYFWMTA